MSDLLIMGSGVVGNIAAACLRRYFPSVRVTVVGRSDQELPIVGESLVELSTHFLQDLGLSRTLIEQHLPKYGLTYYYKLDPSRPRDPGYIVDEAPSNPPFQSALPLFSHKPVQLRRRAAPPQPAEGRALHRGQGQRGKPGGGRAPRECFGCCAGSTRSSPGQPADFLLLHPGTSSRFSPPLP